VNNYFKYKMKKKIKNLFDKQKVNLMKDINAFKISDIDVLEFDLG